MSSKYRTAALGALLLSGHALADCTVTATNELICRGEVRNLLVSDSFPGVLFSLTGVNVDSPPCRWGNVNNAGWWQFSKSHPMYRDWFTQLLTARAVDAEVRVWSYANDPPDPTTICRIRTITWVP